VIGWSRAWPQKCRLRGGLLAVAVPPSTAWFSRFAIT